MYNYRIIFPHGDKTKLKAVYIGYNAEDYAIASRKEFEDYEEAKFYARALASKNNLTFVSDDQEDHYLD